MAVRKSTMADVAKVAGISASTAARVLNNNGYVSKEVRVAVLRAAEEVGYQPNLQARGLRTARSQTLGLVYSDESNPVFTKLAQALRIAAGASGYSLISFEHREDGTGELAGIRHFLSYGVEVAITAHAHSPAAYEPLRKAGIPIIQIERMFMPDTHIVSYDIEPGLSAAVELLTSLGHRRIGFIGGADLYEGRSRPMVDIESIRAETFLDEVRRRGLATTDCPVEQGKYTDRDASGMLVGDMLVQRMLEQNKVTAIVAGSDILAAGILQGLYTRKLRVPEDISLIGYDDSISDLLAPPLHTIRQPYDLIAAAVMEIVAQAHGPLQKRHVATALVSRKSVGPAAA